MRRVARTSWQDKKVSLAILKKHRFVKFLQTLSIFPLAFTPSHPLHHLHTTSAYSHPYDTRTSGAHRHALAIGMRDTATAESSELSLNVPGGIWPEKAGKFYRFVSRDDPTFGGFAFDSALGYACKTPDKFRGVSQDGVYDGSFRLHFTLPGKDDDPKTIELLRSRRLGSPSFGAVKMKLPLDAVVFTKDSRLMVKAIGEGREALESGIEEGDIIRAISVPDGVPDAEEGMFILDADNIMPAMNFNSALQVNRLMRGEEAEVVLLVERPLDSIQPLSRAFFPTPPAWGFVKVNRTYFANTAKSEENSGALWTTVEDVKKDIHNLLREEPHWEKYADDFTLYFGDPTDATVTSLSLPTIRFYLGYLREFRKKYIVSEAVNIQVGLPTDHKRRVLNLPCIAATGQTRLEGRGLPLPMPASFHMDIGAEGQIYFNEQGKVSSAIVEAFSINQFPVSLPRLLEDLSEAMRSPEFQHARLSLWAMQVLFGSEMNN